MYLSVLVSSIIFHLKCFPIETLCSQFTGITAGIVVAHTVALEEVLGTELLWHLALSAYAIPTILCFAVGIFLPESPKYLYVVANDKVSACRGE